MKKDKRSFYKILITFFMGLFVSFGIYYASIKDADSGQVIKVNGILADNEAIDTFNNRVYDSDLLKVMDELIVFQEKDYDQVEASKMIARLEKIPYSILEKLEDENINIILSNTNITEVKEYKHLKGVTPRGWEGTGRTWDDVPGAGGKPVVARIGYSEPGEAHSAINLELHETAHAIDAYVFNDISSTKEFKEIWKQEVNSVFGDDPYFVNYPEEYLAETFAMYYLNENVREVLRQKAPLTYKFIANLEHEI
jgi:hypothetical protein